MALSHTFASKYNDDTPIPNYYRSSVFCLEKLTTSGISLNQLEEKFSDGQAMQTDSAQFEYAGSVLERISHIRRIANQLGEDIQRYPPLHFPPGKLMEELNLVISDKEIQLLESKRAHMNKENVVLCNNYLRGTCSRGVTCSFSHTSETLVSWLEEWLERQLENYGEESIIITEEFGPEAWLIAFELFAKQGTFTSMTLRGATIDALRVLVAAVRSNALPLLERLDLGKNNIGQQYPRVILKLAKALNYTTSLTGLSIGHNALGSAGALSICQPLFRSQSSQVVSLNLSSNGISFLEHAPFNYLCDALGRSANLKKLSLACNDLGPDGVYRLLAALQEVSSLEFLDLSSVGMDDKGAKHLGVFLSDTPVGQQLRLLNVGWNKMSHEGISSLCDGCFQHRKLEILRIPFNVGVGRKGAMSLAELVKNCNSLTVLDLRWTGLGDDGAATVLDGLATNTSIKELALFGNEISPASEAVFLERMKKRAQQAKENAVRESAEKVKLNSAAGKAAAKDKSGGGVDGSSKPPTPEQEGGGGAPPPMTPRSAANHLELPTEPLTRVDEMW